MGMIEWSRWGPGVFHAALLYRPRGIWSDGDVMYVAVESDGKVYTYNMPDAIDARLAVGDTRGNAGEPVATYRALEDGRAVTRYYASVAHADQLAGCAPHPPPESW